MGGIHQMLAVTVLLLHMQSSLLSRAAEEPNSGLMHTFSSGPQLRGRQPAALLRDADTLPTPGGQQHAPPPQYQQEVAVMVEQLQQEMLRVQEERARVARLRADLEAGTARLAQELAALEQRQVVEAARFEAERAEELRKLQRDRRVLEKQSRAMMKIPSQREKEEVKAVEVGGWAWRRGELAL